VFSIQKKLSDVLLTYFKFRESPLYTCRGIESVSGAFHVLFPADMVELFVKHTNSRIQHVQDNLPEYYARTNKNTYIRPLTHREFYA